MVIETIPGRVSTEDTCVDFEARLQVPVEPDEPKSFGINLTPEGQAQIEGESQRARVALENQLSMVAMVSVDWKPLGSPEGSVPLTSKLDD